MILVDVIMSALNHLAVSKCPRCLTGELIVDVRAARFDCAFGCSDVAGAILEAAPRLTDGLKGEGDTLAMLCRKARRTAKTRQQIEREYTNACRFSPSMVAFAAEIADACAS